MRQHSDKYVLSVSGTAASHVFENNPHVLHRDGDQGEMIVMEYPLIHQSNQSAAHFMEGYLQFLGQKLGIEIKSVVNRPQLYLSEEEKAWLPQVHEVTGKPVKYWVVCSGVKDDYTVKGWGPHNYQAVVDKTTWVQWVQVGESDHNHKPLSGVLDMRGKTDLRQLIRMCYHAEGGLGGVSLLHHLFAALAKPFVCVASGMEAVAWERYQGETYLSKGHCVPCGKDGGCWRSRVVPLKDGNEKDKSLCELPFYSGSHAIPKCMAMIKPDEVVTAILDFKIGGRLS
jgi:hypothetical protein